MIRESTVHAMKKEVSRAKNASIVVGVTRNSKREYIGMLENGNARADTKLGDLYYEIGSTTKTFTSLLLAKLITENVVSLDDPVSKYKPAYKQALTYKGKEVTFRHLATHTSGLPREDMKTIRKQLKENKERKNNPYKDFSPDDLDRFFTNYKMKREIGKKFVYSNIGIGLLANTIADIFGMTYEEAIKAQILEPLRMNDTFINVDESHLDRYVKAYDKKGKLVPPIELPAINGAGAIKSTMNDMLTYVEHQIGLNESPLQEAIALTHEGQAVNPSKHLDMGLCWMIENKKWAETPVIHHGGTTVGFHTYCGFMKEHKIGIVIFSTIQIPAIRLIKMIVGLEELVNVAIADAIFKYHLPYIKS